MQALACVMPEIILTFAPEIHKNPENIQQMNDRFKRLEVIRVLLSNSPMGSHAEILKELERNGIIVTQATLSRDMNKMRAMKVVTAEGYRYVLPESPLYKRTVSPQVVPQFLSNSGFVRIDFSGNMAVMHTRPGYASGLASDIDSHKLTSVIGTLAGDDTILIIMAEKVSRQQLIDDLATVVPAIKSVVL